jgi:hypothetical protein
MSELTLSIIFGFAGIGIGAILVVLFYWLRNWRV